nr:MULTISPECIES: R3H domain-containing nucleic acid-binding protein [unclassified Actinopolyspora]
MLRTSAGESVAPPERRQAVSETVQEAGQDEQSVAGGAEQAADAGSGSSGEADLVREGDIAGDYLERLLDLLDYDGDIDLDVESGRAVVSVEGGKDLEKLVGSQGEVLEAMQELTRLAVQQETGVRSRLMLDIAGWRANRRDELTELGRRTAEKVAEDGKTQRLRPMTPFERKVVHDAVAAVSGVTSEGDGEPPSRRVVVYRVE